MIPATATPPPAWRSQAAAFAQYFTQHALPPLVVMGLLVGIWELLCHAPGAALPPPSQVIADTWGLITGEALTGQAQDARPNGPTP